MVHCTYWWVKCYAFQLNLCEFLLRENTVDPDEMSHAVFHLGLHSLPNYSFVCLSVCLSSCLSFCLSVCLIVCLFVLLLYIPAMVIVNSYGHGGTVSSPYHTFPRQA